MRDIPIPIPISTQSRWKRSGSRHTVTLFAFRGRIAARRGRPINGYLDPRLCFVVIPIEVQLRYLAIVVVDDNRERVLP